jgi:hypothetical protein
MSEIRKLAAILVADIVGRTAARRRGPSGFYPIRPAPFSEERLLRRSWVV